MVGTGPAMFSSDPGAKEGERILGMVETPEGKGTVSGNMVLRFTGPGELLANGHPQAGQPAREPAADPLDDLGETFDVVDGTAEADYHELEVFGDRIFAVTVESPDIQVSSDGGKTWQKQHAARPADRRRRQPGDPDHWAVSTEQGTFVSTNGGNPGAPATPRSALAWPGRRRTRSTASTATASSASARTAARAGRTAAMSAASRAKLRLRTKRELFAAIVGGKIRKSTDGGKTWPRRPPCAERPGYTSSFGGHVSTKVH